VSRVLIPRGRRKRARGQRRTKFFAVSRCRVRFGHAGQLDKNVGGFAARAILGNDNEVDETATMLATVAVIVKRPAVAADGEVWSRVPVKGRAAPPAGFELAETESGGDVRNGQTIDRISKRACLT
jgi:hypothetical protein